MREGETSAEFSAAARCQEHASALCVEKHAYSPPANLNIDVNWPRTAEKVADCTYRYMIRTEVMHVV